jgi:hypothetical protein
MSRIMAKGALFIKKAKKEQKCWSIFYLLVESVQTEYVWLPRLFPFQRNNGLFRSLFVW